MEEATPPELGALLELLRCLMGWSQRKLARVARTPQPLVSGYETGKRRLTKRRLIRLLAVMGLDAEAIDLTLLWSKALRPTVEPVQWPVDPLPKAQRRIRQQVLSLLLTQFHSAAEPALQELTRSYRKDRALEERRDAAELWAELEACPSRERWARVEEEPLYWTWALCERLCAESEKVAAHDALEALGLAQLALRIAELVEGGEPWRSHLLGYVWAFVGNARRVQGDLPGAAEAFARAWNLWKAGPPGEGDPLEEWRLLDLEASLKRDQREFPEAVGLLERAMRQSRQPQDKARILLKLAVTLEKVGACEQAIEVLKTAGELVGVFDEPRLQCVLKFNLVVNLCHLGRYEEAEPVFSEVREVALDLANGFDLLRVRWLEGRIAAGLGRRAEAIEILSRVRYEFADRGIAYDMALATLELSTLYLEEGRAVEVRTLARQMAPVFRSQGVHREALAALRVFSQAAALPEAIDIALVRGLVRYLERARHDPGLRFVAATDGLGGGAG